MTMPDSDTRTVSREQDIKTVAEAILGGTSYLPHREAAERLLAAALPASQDNGLRADSIEELAGALYETDPPESWMRTGSDEYRKRAAAMLDIIARDRALAATPDPAAHTCANHDESLDEAYRKGLADGLRSQGALR